MFHDRVSAGRSLAAALKAMNLPDPVVLALPRGGVPVAAPIARALHAPLDLLLVRKIGAAQQPELAVAAVGEGGSLAVNDEPLRSSGLSRRDIERLARIARREIARQRSLYLRGRAAVSTAGRTAIVVDDGIATGATMRAALALLRQRRPARIVLAVPVAPHHTIEELRGEVDELVCLEAPTFFMAVGTYYEVFGQTQDDEVIRLLDAAERELS
jgi:putative phosphoribosyl transferase